MENVVKHKIIREGPSVLWRRRPASLLSDFTSFHLLTHGEETDRFRDKSSKASFTPRVGWRIRQFVLRRWRQRFLLPHTISNPANCDDSWVGLDIWRGFCAEHHVRQAAFWLGVCVLKVSSVATHGCWDHFASAAWSHSGKRFTAMEGSTVMEPNVQPARDDWATRFSSLEMDDRVFKFDLHKMSDLVMRFDLLEIKIWLTWDQWLDSMI